MRLPHYRELSGFTEANDAYLDVALDLGEQALVAALDEAKVKPSELDIVFSTTVTGLAVPTLEARLATRVGLRPDVKRVPLFGLGCVAGAAGWRACTTICAPSPTTRPRCSRSNCAR